MTRTIGATLLILFISPVLNAEIIIRGTIYDVNGKPPQLAHIHLTEIAGDYLNPLKTVQTDSNGMFILKLKKKGNYKIWFKAVGHQITNTPIFLNKNTDQIIVTVNLEAYKNSDKFEGKKIIDYRNNFNIDSTNTMVTKIEFDADHAHLNKIAYLTQIFYKTFREAIEAVNFHLQRFGDLNEFNFDVSDLAIMLMNEVRMQQQSIIRQIAAYNLVHSLVIPGTNHEISFQEIIEILPYNSELWALNPEFIGPMMIRANKRDPQKIEESLNFFIEQNPNEKLRAQAANWLLQMAQLNDDMYPSGEGRLLLSGFLS